MDSDKTKNWQYQVSACPTYTITLLSSAAQQHPPPCITIEQTEGFRALCSTQFTSQWLVTTTVHRVLLYPHSDRKTVLKLQRQWKKNVLLGHQFAWRTQLKRPLISSGFLIYWLKEEETVLRKLHTLKWITVSGICISSSQPGLYAEHVLCSNVHE